MRRWTSRSTRSSRSCTDISATVLAIIRSFLRSAGDRRDAVRGADGGGDVDGGAVAGCALQPECAVDGGYALAHAGKAHRLGAAAGVGVEAEAVVAHAQRGLILVDGEAHPHGFRLRVLDDVIQRLLEDTVERLLTGLRQSAITLDVEMDGE